MFLCNGPVLILPWMLGPMAVSLLMLLAIARPMVLWFFSALTISITIGRMFFDVACGEVLRGFP